jgi:shikimate kinase
LTESAVNRVVLVGFMGAGKTSVGRALAAQLGWRFFDLDHEIVRRSGRSIRDWFSDLGESAFRREEASVAQELLSEDEIVLATGGGWAAEPGRLSRLHASTLSVWLEVDAEESLRRAGRDVIERPLLSRDIGVQAARGLLESRRTAYALASLRVDTNGKSIEDVTSHILENFELSAVKTEPQ